MPDAPVYDASAFDPALPKGRSSGRLSFSAVSASFAADAKTIELPLSGLKIERGGAAGRLVFLSHPSLPGVSVFTGDERLLDDPTLAAPELAAQVAEIRSQKRAGTALTVGALLAVAGFLGLLYQVKDPATRAVARKMPPAIEQKIGEAAFAQLKLGKAFVDTPAAKAGLDKIVSPLLKAVPEAPFEFKFHIVRDSTVNASALPGGYVVVHTGLLLAAESPEEVAGVLAHELAHVMRRHHVQSIVGSVGLMVVVQALIGDASGLWGALIDQGAGMASRKFSRDHERDADESGWSYLLAAGVDPRGMIRFFEKLQKEKGGALGSLESHLAFLSTHPATQERIDRLKSAWEKEPKKDGFAPIDLDFKAFQQELRR